MEATWNRGGESTVIFGHVININKTFNNSVETVTLLWPYPHVSVRVCLLLAACVLSVWGTDHVTLECGLM